MKLSKRARFFLRTNRASLYLNPIKPSVVKKMEGSAYIGDVDDWRNEQLKYLEYQFNEMKLQLKSLKSKYPCISPSFIMRRFGVRPEIAISLLEKIDD